MRVNIFLLVCLFGVGKTKEFQCKKSEFQCKNGQCIPINEFCNGFNDCNDLSDEPDNCSQCNRTYLGEVGRVYQLDLKRPKFNDFPFLCFLNFTAAGGPFGELIQITFESFDVGTFESFTTEGCPNGFISLKEGNRPPTGGKWCGNIWRSTVYYSETSSINITLYLDFHHQQSYFSKYEFKFKISYRLLRLSDARTRYGNATQRSYRGKLSSGTYCDRLLEGCSRRPCRIQSPNYPGIYPRNISCNYRIRERNVPPEKHALIAVRDRNYHVIERILKFDNSDRIYKIWDECNTMQDYMDIMDGWAPGAATLVHLCSGESVPETISSGPEMLIKFNTSPFGSPFHPLPISYLPGFELEVEVFFVDKESPTYIEQGKKCEFLFTSREESAGVLSSPLHSLPPNTTCHYHFRGHSKEIVWISFTKYHVSHDRLCERFANKSDCDVQLQIWDGNIKDDKPINLMGQFCRYDTPKLCDHSLLMNYSRSARPCGLSESYISSGSDLTITQTIRRGSVMDPTSFVLRYEFVDLSQEGYSFSRNPCDRIFREHSGRFYSPKIPFLYGRGGQKDLTCNYQFESYRDQYLKFTFLKTKFRNRECTSLYNRETGHWVCQFAQDYAYIKILEYPWPGVELLRDCLCNSITDTLVIKTRTARKVLVQFTITNMKITEDYHDFSFEANYEFLPTNCNNPNIRRLRGSSGEITVRNNAQTLTQINHRDHHHYHNQSKVCLHHPWLIEPEDSLNNFIYLKIRGINKDSRLCPSKNRIFVYPAARTENVHIICPYYESADDVVEMFSEGWSAFNYRKNQHLNSRSFIIEFVQRESGNFIVNWMEVSKNPALTLPNNILMINPPNCPHSCPELGACISSELWCDGLRHCPSGSDEQESNCSLDPGTGFPISYLNSVALSTAVLVLIIIIISVTFYVFKHWKREQKNVIVSVTEHTFLEFKSGLC